MAIFDTLIGCCVHIFFREAAHVEPMFHSIWFICHIWFLLFFSFHFARKFKRTNIKWMPKRNYLHVNEISSDPFSKMLSLSLSLRKCHAFDAFCCHCNGLYSVWTLQKRQQRQQNERIKCWVDTWMPLLWLLLLVLCVFFTLFQMALEWKLTYAITFLVVICS